ncbi:hypothetical protein SLS60_005446 [Paraconiothyrium brasiliense]|uniref:Uncharacterized protein n=1 Tax=Paraconiothyrium brasiliense TaxID=300254 RepID=A0ABR3RI84_9PLEO
MPFLAEEHIRIPGKDLMSWMFDEQTYDPDQPIYCSMIFLGVLAFGGIFAGTNPSHTAFELAHAFKVADVRGIVVEPELLPNALKAAKEADIPFSRIFVFDHHASLAAPYNVDEGWSVTSSVKGPHTLVYDYKPRDYELSRLLCTPLFHVSNVPRAHTSPLHSGSKTYIMRRFELEPFLRNMERFKITELNMVPPMVIQVINSPLSRKYSLKAVKNGGCGAAPLAAEPQARMKALLNPDAVFNQVWGMSETSCIATMTLYPEHDPTGSVGRFLPNHDAKLVDEEGKDVTDYDVAGELCVRGPLIVKGYYNNPEANRTAFDSDGYFHTGDVALRRRYNGLWYIVDRKKELIKVRGFQCAPAELEGVLLSHPEISDAGVIGIPAAGFGSSAGEQGSEVPRAYIVRKQGARLDESGVHEWMRGRLAGYKQLVGGIKFVDVIPKNASGKILKGELRAMAKKELGAKL